MARWLVQVHAGSPKPTSHGVRTAADLSIGISWEEFHKECGWAQWLCSVGQMGTPSYYSSLSKTQANTSRHCSYFVLLQGLEAIQVGLLATLRLTCYMLVRNVWLVRWTLPVLYSIIMIIMGKFFLKNLKKQKTNMNRSERCPHSNTDQATTSLPQVQLPKPSMSQALPRTQTPCFTMSSKVIAVMCTRLSQSQSQGR